MARAELKLEVAVVGTDEVRAAVRDAVSALLGSLWEFAAAGFACGLVVGALLAWGLR